LSFRILTSTVFLYYTNDHIFITSRNHWNFSTLRQLLQRPHCDSTWFG